MVEVVFQKDVLALKKAGNDVDYEFKIVDAVLNVNKTKIFTRGESEVILW